MILIWLTSFSTSIDFDCRHKNNWCGLTVDRFKIILWCYVRINIGPPFFPFLSFLSYPSFHLLLLNPGRLWWHFSYYEILNQIRQQYAVMARKIKVSSSDPLNILYNQRIVKIMFTLLSFFLYLLNLKNYKSSNRYYFVTIS